MRAVILDCSVIIQELSIANDTVAIFMAVISEALRFGTHCKGSYVICTPVHLLANGMNHAFAFTAEAASHFADIYVLSIDCLC